MMAEPTDKHDPAVQTLHRAAQDAEIHFRRPPDGRAVEHGMIGNDVVADARMNRQRHVQVETLRQHAGLLVRDGSPSWRPAAR